MMLVLCGILQVEQIIVLPEMKPFVLEICSLHQYCSSDTISMAIISVRGMVKNT